MSNMNRQGPGDNYGVRGGYFNAGCEGQDRNENVNHFNHPSEERGDGWGRGRGWGRGHGRGQGRGRGRGRGRGTDFNDTRGAKSLESLSNFSSADSKFRNTSNRGNRRERNYPMGYKELERILTLPSDAVAFELLNERSGFRLLLEEDKMSLDKLILLVKVLSQATETQSSKENLYELFNKTCEQRFMDKLCTYSISIKRQCPDKAKDFFAHLHVFIEAYANAMTTTAINRLPDLVDVCISTLTYLEQNNFVSKELVKQYNNLQDMLTTASKSWEQKLKHQAQGTRKGMNEMDHMAPPDDFKELSVFPTPLDFMTIHRPFLRRNLTQGKYDDGEHYLDVQFRLLREDFVRPLRNGINDFKGKNHSKVRDVKIYRDVAIVSSRVKSDTMIYMVQLNMSKKIRLETSKRLLFGNLLCFTNDGFKTLILASVAERDPEKSKEGIVGVQFESDIEQLDLSGRFIMVESKAYFMAYKHVLMALQNMSGKTIPMAPYIIKVEPNVEAPKYLTGGEKYDLRVMKNDNMMKKSEAHSSLFHGFHFIRNTGTNEPEDVEEPEDQCDPLMNVVLAKDLSAWPSEAELGVDSSQCRALKSALTRQLAIIQGPPGTGKTFIGLKITQILLHNSNAWKEKQDSTPILVVCFTNHALDQFLEGMTTYTRNIVRVGSRSMSETINQFQINSLLRTLRANHDVPRAVFERNFELRNEVRKIGYKIDELRCNIEKCKSGKGILPLDTFESEGIIPPHLQHQLRALRCDKKLTGWLLLNIQPETGLFHKQLQVAKFNVVDKPKSSKPTSSKLQTTRGTVEKEEGELSEDEFKDAEEFLNIEEQDRLVEDHEIDDSAIIHGQIKSLRFETTDNQLREEIVYASFMLQENEGNEEAYYKQIITSSLREALNIGLELPENPDVVCELENQEHFNISHTDFPQRWQLYKHWLGKLLHNMTKKLKALESNCQKKSRALRETRNQEYLYAMRSASVVGMTTTGAAQYNSIMQDLAPSIVIIEEAAEILESHVITSLTAKCKHLILIGDHQQLRPSATVYELATKYGLETSLFERLIKNGLAYETLEYQHRMRPSISRLLVPSIYPELKNHPSVDLYPRIRGISKNVFFISHEIPEREDTDDNNSHENAYEAEFMICLCRHLLLQGYSSKEITILTPYSGQFFLLRKIQRDHTACHGVKICVVDNFQGEENNIILLSLVRSNVEGNVGFLRTDNRICVALSRAKHGLYITGNMELLSAHSELWKKIKEDLAEQGAIGNILTLQCENHPDKLISVSSGEDILKKSPEGGCLQTCWSSLPHCNHSCPRLCHLDDRDHTEVQCRVPCPKILCELDHPCPRQCWEECTPCEVLVNKDLPCGHSHMVHCHVKPEVYKCPTPVTKEIPHCQHEAIMPCHIDPKYFLCPTDCDTRLDCGHKCRLRCHRTVDPDHLTYNCLESCTRLNAGCTENHLCQRICHETCGACIVKVEKILPCGHRMKNVECSKPAEEIKCRKPCKKTLPCQHPCKMLCFQDCGNCAYKVQKTIPGCNHTAQIECGLLPTKDMCEGKCPQKLSCGHPCEARCKDLCTVLCKKLVVSAINCPKGHSIMLPCHLNNTVNGEEAWSYCKAPCNQLLNCEHNCVGDCGSCFQGRVHVFCRQPCRKPLVCGHICKYPCSADCPPCQEECQWRCKHSRCKKKCGIPCNMCKMECDWKCKHLQCIQLCGDRCSRKPCDKKCPRKLKCGHPCVGFCGDPCPPLCRTCNFDELTEFVLLGYEEDGDARFVLLEDCGHSIEVQGLEGWLNQETAVIGMKTCPKCRKPIYNNRRYQNIVLETYKSVLAVKNKYFTCKPKIKRKDIELILKDPEIALHFMSHIKTLHKKLGMNNYGKQKRQSFVNEGELRVIQFQANVLKTATSILKCMFEENSGLPVNRIYRYKTKLSLSRHGKRLQPRVVAIIERVMEKDAIVAAQLVDEASCELQLLKILPAFWNFQEKFATNSANEVREIKARLEKLMDPTVKFDAELESKVHNLLKESEKYVGGLGISQDEKFKILEAMKLKQGHWYKCPNGHIYCITECGGAMEEAQCPECKAVIGGTSHRLRSDNAVATEMDGAQRGAWSEGNNMGNFNLQDVI